MTPEQRFEELWGEFEKQVVPQDAGDEQRGAMYMAFLAGALTASTYYLHLRQHAPTNIDQCMIAWSRHCQSETKRMLEAHDGR